MNGKGKGTGCADPDARVCVISKTVTVCQKRHPKRDRVSDEKDRFFLAGYVGHSLLRWRQNAGHLARTAARRRQWSRRGGGSCDHGDRVNAGYPGVLTETRLRPRVRHRRRRRLGYTHLPHSKEADTQRGALLRGDHGRNDVREG